MMPCIFLSTSCSVVSAFLDNHKYVTMIIAAVNGVIAFLLAIINYLKLDACSEAHKISSYQYSKLKSYIEFTSGEILLFQDPLVTNKNHAYELMKSWKINHRYTYRSEREYKKEKCNKMGDILKEKEHIERKIIGFIQGKIMEFKKSLKNIQENNKFILPKHIAKRYSNIYNVNIFTYIKTIESYRLYLFNELRNVKNEIRFYIHLNDDINTEDKNKVKCLYHRKNNILKEVFELNNGYALIDSMFQQEIKNIYLYRKYWYLFYLQNVVNVFLCCLCFKSINADDGVIHTRRKNGIFKTDLFHYFIPSEYKKATKFGYVDEDGVYMLEKIMEYSRKANITCNEDDVSI